MDETMKQFQEGLIELETEAEHLLLARHQLVENDRVRNGNREALTALRKRARTTKTSVPSPFESIMRDIGGPESRPLVKEVCTTCGNHDSNERTWMMFPGTDLIGRIPFHAAHTILETDQAQLDFDAKRLQSYMKEKSLLISERGAIADRISPGVLKSLITLSDKPNARPLLKRHTEVVVKAEIFRFKIGTIARKLFNKKLVGEVAKLLQFSPSRMYFNEVYKHIIFVTDAYSTYKHF